MNARKHRSGHSHLPSDRPNERPRKPVESVIFRGHVKIIEAFGALVSFALNKGLEPLVGFCILQMRTCSPVEKSI